MRARRCLLYLAVAVFVGLLLPVHAFAGVKTEVKGIRYWSSDGHTRVVIDLSGEADMKNGRIPEPDRLFIDLSGSILPRDIRRAIQLGEGPLKGVRAAQYDADTVRVVFDLARIENYKIFTLSDPPRVVVDVFGASAEKTTREAVAVRTESPTEDAVGAKAPEGKSPGETIAQAAPAPQSEAEKEAAIKRLAEEKSAAKGEGIPDIRRVWKVVIDAGHGGHDPGAIGVGGLREKDVVLDIAKRLKRVLEEKGGYEVYLTRDGDRFLSLEERTVLANKKGADLFVSIHANAHNSASVRGLETYFLNFTNDAEAIKVAARENMISTRRMHKARTESEVILASLELQNNRDESLNLANYVQAGMLSKLGGRYDEVRNLGVKQALFYVLFGAKMPSVLVEVSFITNPVEAARLKSQAYREDLAAGIAAGVERYFDTLSPAQKVALRY